MANDVKQDIPGSGPALIHKLLGIRFFLLTFMTTDSFFT